MLNHTAGSAGWGRLSVAGVLRVCVPNKNGLDVTLSLGCPGIFISKRWRIRRAAQLDLRASFFEYTHLGSWPPPSLAPSIQISTVVAKCKSHVFFFFCVRNAIPSQTLLF